MKKIHNSITETFNLLDKSKKIKYFIILFLFLVSALLESVGIGLIFTLLASITSENFNFALPILNELINKINFLNDTKNILLIIVILYLIKSLFLNFFYWFTNKYIFESEAFIAKKLYLGYLYSPLSFHLNHNSSELVRNITVETGQFSGQSLTVSLLFFKNIFLLFALLTLLLIINPFITLAAFVCLSLLALLNHMLMSKKYYNWGKERQIHTGLRLKELQQGFLGIKTIKFFDKEKFFFSKFLPHLYEINNIRLKQTFFKEFPRIWLEFISVAGCVFLFFILSGEDNIFLNALPVLSALALVLMRMIPAINNLINNLQSFNYSYASIEKIKNDLKIIENNEKKYQSKKELFFKNTIELKNINFQYNKSSKKVINNLNLKIKKNSIIGIIGPSGEGKSTLLNIFLGLLNPQTGSIEIDGLNIFEGMASWQKLIGYIPQDIFLTDESVKSNIAFGIEEKQVNKVRFNLAVQQAQLSNFINNLPNREETLVGELGERISGGEKQRLGIARALYNDPDILVLDEATKSLDNKNEKKINEVVEQFIGKKTIIIVSHLTNSLEKCDYVYLLKNGKLIENK